MSDILLEVLGHGAGRVLIYAFLLPVSCLFATPAIIVAACFMSGKYGENIRPGCRRVFDFWDGILPHVD